MDMLAALVNLDRKLDINCMFPFIIYSDLIRSSPLLYMVSIAVYILYTYMTYM